MKKLSLATFSKIGLRTGASLAFALLGIVGVQSALAQTYTVLHAFTGSPDGALPEAGLIRDAKGNLYGTTFVGGKNHCNKAYGVGCGTVFKIDAAGQATVLYSFDVKHGQYPHSTLVQDGSGNLYGITQAEGGQFSRNTAFQLTPDGKHVILHEFDGGPGGLFPSPLILDSGNLYGTTITGGNSTGSGVLFKLNKSGKETVLYTFTCMACQGQKGGGFGNPQSVLRDSARNFYGTAGGGTRDAGVVYKVDPSGTGSVLYSFKGGKNGWDPLGRLTMDLAGNLYGTTRNDNGSACNANGCGTVFKVDPTGHERVLYRFAGGPDGGYPNGGMVQDSQGNLYGTTWIGGGNAQTCNPYSLPVGCGVVFKLDPHGTETILHTFANLADGGFPNGDLVLDEAGNLYGTTYSGGDPTCNCGVVFKIAP
jgi:uncharacterized repeat protein (TIGR03803 family)